MVKIFKKQRGFTLVESMVCITVFVLLAVAIYQTFFVISKETQASYENTIVSNLADQYLEIVRNLPYSQIGTLAGNPTGNLPDSPNPINITVNTKSYQVYYEVTYIDDPADGTAILLTDTAPNDYKQVKISVKNITTAIVKKFITNVAPRGLESLTSGGALLLSVIDAVGQPVPGASIHIENNILTPNINITRTSAASGNWVEVGLPNKDNSYHITVTKDGYSSDQTYPITGSNPSPTKPDATILNGKVTSISFAIDRTSNLTFNTLNQTCATIPSVGLAVQGSKLIGTPNVYKFNNTYTTNGIGQIVLSNTEWNNYTPTLTGNTLMIYGSSPIQQINLLPNTTQQFNIILGTKTTNSLLIIVKDASTGNPIEGASVELKNISPAYDTTLITGGSLWSQQFWNGGVGQAIWSDVTKYFSNDGGISTTDIPLAMRLTNYEGSTTAMSGSVVSSTFDTGSSDTAYTTFNWQPASQDPETEAKFQIATNNDNTTWNFTGPDGTSGSFYVTPGMNISASNNNKRYLRYKTFLSTTNNLKNPTITNTSINYISGCFTPGQVMFPGLVSGNNYQVTASMTGYQSKTVSDLNVSGYNTLQVQLTPN